MKVGDGRALKAEAEGTVKLKVYHDERKSITLLLKRVLHVPEMSCNLLSVRGITEKGYSMNFERNGCSIITERGDTIATSQKLGNLYILNGNMVQVGDEERANLISESDLWHRRLGHVSDGVLRKLTNGEVATGVNFKGGTDGEFRDSCAKGKASRKTPKPLEEIRAKRRLEMVYSDVCGPMSVQTATGKRYLITFTDDYSRYSFVFFMAKKSESFAMFMQFQAEAVGGSGQEIGTLRTDGGGEYKSAEFQSYLVKNKIHHEETIPNTPEQNGVAERLNRTLLEKIRPMLTQAGLPKIYWAEAANTANYLKNRTTSQALLGTTSYEMWFDRKPDLSHLRTFGCVTYAHIPDGHRKKLDDKSEMLRFMGYNGGKGYRLMDEKTKKIKFRKDVTFDEEKFTFHNSESDTAKDDIMTVTTRSDPSLRAERRPAVMRAERQTMETRAERQPTETRAEEPEVEAARDENRVPETRPARNRQHTKRYGIDEIYLAEILRDCAIRFQCAARSGTSIHEAGF